MHFLVTSIEDISQTFASLERPIGNRWHLHALAPKRLHLSVSHEGAPTLFIEGDAASFGRLPTLHGLEHREDAIDVQTGNVFKALRITAPQEPHGNEALAVIAYEVARIIESEPDADNGTLLAGVNWILKVLGIEASVLSGGASARTSCRTLAPSPTSPIRPRTQRRFPGSLGPLVGSGRRQA